ncbi:uncharacterized protein PGTG_03670 [Puccinia graminis f. sp. tritici CRL 75-36-700-3]|uniref:Uncharacterized protein n=1 Tax=Puccinia graminis f. sp. tritici (strain CRL 75-36-700-3 / race SCCL) TaxID=418459 RepID=E3K089_PUCGT|nr:uncharacterized protein PGTG_03670 [Puccinia graminis f. sp. tritici CRL 75-36-700-3]EFP77714.2 hypothetical protein PGTG_03670 [Puccinia graminis f. sp. tritici CRL 75-36-700-3]
MDSEAELTDKEVSSLFESVRTEHPPGSTCWDQQNHLNQWMYGQRHRQSRVKHLTSLPGGQANSASKGATPRVSNNSSARTSSRGSALTQVSCKSREITARFSS